MTKPRLGKKDSIFSATTATAPAAGIAARPTTEATTTSVENKMTVILPPDQVAFLDQLALNIRSNTGWKTRRTEIIRALVAALMKADIDLTRTRSEDDFAATVAARLKG